MVRVLFVIWACVSFVLPSLVVAADGTVVPERSWVQHFDLSMVLTAVVWVVITISIINFGLSHRGEKKDEEGERIKGSRLLEIAWTAVPFVILLLFGVRM